MPQHLVDLGREAYVRTMRMSDRPRPGARRYVGILVVAVSVLVLVALVAVPFAVAQSPTFVLNFWYSTSKMNSSGETRFCIRVTTRPAQKRHTVIVTIQRAKHGAQARRMKGRFNRRGNWYGRIVLGSKRHPAAGAYIYKVTTAGDHTGATGGSPTLGKAFDGGITCTTPTRSVR